MSPKVSVCIPVYNGQDYIAEAVESVLGQTFQNYELIVCDNCSTDDTEKIVRSFRDARIRYFKNENNLGLVGNANRCIDLSQGEYICILHHDDTMFPENLELKTKVLDANPQVGFVHSNVLWVDEKGGFLREWLDEARQDYIEDGKEVFHRYIRRMPKGALIFIGSVMARKACYDRLGKFRVDLPHSNDNEMWLRLSLYYDVACVGKPLVTWRQHGTSASSGWDLSDAWLEEHFLTTEIVFQDYRDKIQHWEKLRQEVGKEFATQTLKRGINACGRDDFEAGERCLGLARRFSRDSLLTYKDYWRLKIRLMLGSEGARLYRVFKAV